jgi:hypothetical protein
MPLGLLSVGSQGWSSTVISPLPEYAVVLASLVGGWSSSVSGTLVKPSDKSDEFSNNLITKTANSLIF